MRTEFDAELEARLVRYAVIDTQSDDSSTSVPTTARQLDLSRLLVEELTAIGAADVRLTEYGTVLATLPATIPATLQEAVPTIAWLAHVDTAPAYFASGVKPLVHRNYDGGEIRFPDAPDLVLAPANAPYLGGKLGDDIVTASGATLLGADDKAGVAIVMTAARHLLDTPDLPHGRIRLAFTPDEEIGRGVHDRLPADLDARAGYTLDGRELGEICHETFSADMAIVTVDGVSAHTGWAKGRMVNALHLATKIAAALPQATLTPETTDGRDGFIHLHEISGTAARATLRFILRDFSTDRLAAHGALIAQVAEAVAATEPRARVTCETVTQYRNMHDTLQNDMRPVDLAHEACRRAGIEPFSSPVRGGTDGALLTAKGVPTPNIFTGMQEPHGPLEWVSVQDMAAATRMLIELAGLWADRPD